MKTPRYDPPPVGSPPRAHLVAALTAAIRALEAVEILADAQNDPALSRDASRMSGTLTGHASRMKTEDLERQVRANKGKKGKAKP